MSEDEEMTEIGPREFARRMQILVDNDDIERRHEDADALMCEVLTSLGYDEGVKSFVEMSKWYA